ncbi:MAG: ATP-binding protein, partial [Erysipelotrichaceae bacterium]|nr:ATP-binding protein [Erysipelotrichaceae bacterium]
MEKFISCGKCDDGFYYEGDYCRKCSCLKNYQSRISIQIGLSKANILDEEIPSLDKYKGSDVTGNLIKLRKYSEGILDRYARNSHLYLVGPNGSQKTYTAKALVKEAVSKGLSCKFIIMNDLIRKLVDIYEEGYNESIEEYYKCNLLVIDDCFDPKKVTIFKSGYQ